VARVGTQRCTPAQPCATARRRSYARAVLRHVPREPVALPQNSAKPSGCTNAAAPVRRDEAFVRTQGSGAQRPTSCRPLALTRPTNVRQRSRTTDSRKRKCRFVIANRAGTSTRFDREEWHAARYLSTGGTASAPAPPEVCSPQQRLRENRIRRTSFIVLYTSNPTRHVEENLFFLEATSCGLQQAPPAPSSPVRETAVRASLQSATKMSQVDSNRY